MISDETRELLSAYVDGELRDADAARVEEWIKRDPELQRELQAYRALGRSLREWDGALSADGPSEEMDRRARARVFAWLRAGRAAPRVTAWARLARPLAAAALLLLTAGGAVLLASAPDGLRVTGPVARLDPAESPRAWPAPTRLAPEASDGPAWPRPVAIAVDAPARLLADSARGFLVGEEVLSERALLLRDQWTREQEWLERVRGYEEGLPPERRTTARNPAVALLIAGYEPQATALQELVAFRRPHRGPLPAAGPIPLDERAAREGPPEADDPDLLWVSTVDIGRPVLTLAGEVWIGERDRSGRTRVVTQSNWIDDEFFASVVWADRIERPADRSNSLTLQATILGPEARRRILGARGRDDGVLQWIEERFEGRPLARVLERGAAERERAVARLMEALSSDATTTGFAVLADAGAPGDERVLGCELFASHELMLAFAPRLLRGYLLEQGPAGLKIEPRRGDAGELRAWMQHHLDTIAERATRLEEESSGSGTWPEGLRRVTLREPLGAVVGHGLLYDDQPLALSVIP